MTTVSHSCNRIVCKHSLGDKWLDSVFAANTSHTTRLCAVVLRSYADGDMATVNYAILAQHANLCERSVHNSIKVLLRIGLIELLFHEPRHDRVYRFTFERERGQ